MSIRRASHDAERPTTARSLRPTISNIYRFGSVPIFSRPNQKCLLVVPVFMIYALIECPGIGMQTPAATDPPSRELMHTYGRPGKWRRLD